MESRTASIVALHERRSDVDRRRLRAQALAELRALSGQDQEHEAAGVGSDARRTIVLR